MNKWLEPRNPPIVPCFVRIFSIEIRSQRGGRRDNEAFGHIFPFLLSQKMSITWRSTFGGLRKKTNKKAAQAPRVVQNIKNLK